MKIQTLSIEVPTKGCVNKCEFCVSRMHENVDNEFSKFNLKNLDPDGFLFLNDQYIIDLKRRLKYAQSNGVNGIVITGTGEPLQNKDFLSTFARVLKMMDNPFPSIELQTSGVMLTDENLKYLREEIGVSTISLSVSNMFDDQRNMEIIGVAEKLQFKLADVCTKVKEYGFNLRLSLNMTIDYEKVKPAQYFQTAIKLGVNQITFRKLYDSGGQTKQDQWVRENKMYDYTMDEIKTYIVANGTPLYVLPFGYLVMTVNEIGTVVDTDCMHTQNVSEVLKYLILRSDNKLYTHWSDKGSLIF
jgi:molybdenum cofactor biosynthesis enzyme MoaA